MAQDEIVQREPGQVTILLDRARAGDKRAESDLLDLVYDRLHGLAERALRGERREYTLQPTELVSELYLRLNLGSLVYNDRVHFFALASKKIRRFLLDRARSRKAQRRPSSAQRIDIESVFLQIDDFTAEAVIVDDALDRLAGVDPRQARAFELRAFGGLTAAEIAAELGVSERSVKRDLTMAREWLEEALYGDREAASLDTAAP